ncbi:DODA-type extradiol aromatic ring-opening family dioxygenase [Alteromonas lipolytica]|uniref:Dioxygenase n=1 Tax=Alteromonas lipolytica TaxID=1856405 RepID=A0A1E8FJK3_9ALTE|nr:class III extradiol ring-cleavage dioxygenase [Alteromonas lipolytica]OFI35798.1 dioxygenase [Alteromonas lipolytica]GGF80902.1 dioxygenase [Alteromonas lipolytica]
MQATQQALFISHGGGPMPLMGDPGHQALVAHLADLAGRIRRPKAILIVSAHWEASVSTVTTSPKPELIYDYYGFPPETYSIQYPCPGEPELAHQVADALKQAGIPVAEDNKRGLDHGVFVPLKIMYPQADIPCIQLSLVNTLDAAQHIRIGQALANIDYEDLLILGSGFSFHNMRAFFAPDTAQSRALNQGFEAWLRDVLSDTSLSETQRQQKLTDWEQAPGARFCHPREEHLIPLHVCYGAAGRAADLSDAVVVINKQAGTFGWFS